MVNAVCFDCHVWRGGSLDVESTEQPWMYAFRARGKAMASDDLAAGLTQHGFYGRLGFSRNGTRNRIVDFRCRAV